MRNEKNYISLEFPAFITHIAVSNNNWVKIGYNKIHTGMHFSKRASLVASIHGYLEKHIPDDVVIGPPVHTRLIVHAPINYGSVKMIRDKKTNRLNLTWNKPSKSYIPNWDIGNLALIWLKCLDDVLIKKGVLPNDTIEFLKKTSYEFKECEDLKDRKLVYIIETIQ